MQETRRMAQNRPHGPNPGDVRPPESGRPQYRETPESGQTRADGKRRRRRPCPSCKQADPRRSQSSPDDCPDAQRSLTSFPSPGQIAHRTSCPPQPDELPRPRRISLPKVLPSERDQRPYSQIPRYRLRSDQYLQEQHPHPPCFGKKLSSARHP